MFNMPDWENDVSDANFNFVYKEKSKPSISKELKKEKKGKNMTIKTSNESIFKNSQEKQVKKTYNINKNNKSVAENKSNTKAPKLNRNINLKVKSKVTKIKPKNYNAESFQKDLTNNFNSSTTLDQNLKKAKKRKHSEGNINLSNKTTKSSKFENIYNTDRPDEMLISAKKKKHDQEETLFHEAPKQKKSKNKKVTPLPQNEPTKDFLKKQKLKQLLDLNRNTIKTNSSKLRERMLEKLKAAQFRYLNEKLYTSSGTEAQQLFSSDPNAFNTYHQGYRQQLKKWPVNPLDVIVKRIQKMPKTTSIADMGCGEAALSKRVSHSVRSFDLVATAPGVEVCNMAHTPLLTGSTDVAVYCLALMGTELTQYLVEANRILKTGGLLLIAEVESRFDDVNKFTTDVQRLGFKLIKLDKTHNVFFFMEFKKLQDAPSKKGKLPPLSLKPCLYKRR